ncbi:helix-turn-helix domain-containing protein [Streptomyces boninensis]|uniref:helix-turn-helix domain-containing protein n=1 Tax=Streptomyces boninensis TaxID=2039455 RepID=UPI003B20EFB9
MRHPVPFGAELRRLRVAAGLTLTELAASVHYSKGQISKVETGSKRPTSELARLCDAVLEANGALIRLAEDRPPDTAPAATEDGTIAMPEDASGRLPDAPHPSRRQVMATAAATVLSPPTADGDLLTAATMLFAQYRRLAQSSPPSAVLPALTEQTRSLRALASSVGPRTSRGLLAVTARYAEFAGWLSQETGDDTAALRWTGHAVELADAAGDTPLASYALVRRGLIAYYRGDAAATVALAQGAYGHGVPPRIRGLAAVREAQGHALAGDYNASMRSLDRARELLATAAGEPGLPLLGSTNVSDPAGMVTGWCLLDLGRPRRAAELLDEEMSQLPAHALRAQARFGVRQALAHACAGDLDRACDLTQRLLPTADLVGSATIVHDLRRLARRLARHRGHPAYAALSPRLIATLTHHAH